MISEAVHYIDGAWAEPGDREWIAVVNPATDAPIGRVLRGTEADVDRAVAAARRALPEWSAVPMPERIAAVERLSAAIGGARERLAQAMTAEMGAPLDFTRTAQVGVAIADIAALVEAAREHQQRVAVSRSLVVAGPVGVVAAITPWNFPLHQIVLKVVAALLAGCTVVLKPSEAAPFNAVIFAELVDGLGLPRGAVNVVFGNGSQVGEAMCAHPDVDMVTFTGSRGVGERIAVSSAGTIKKVALELGGKSAAIILPDAPVETSAADVVRSCFANAGQTCAALSRVLVPREMAGAWERAAGVAAAQWEPADPLAEGSAMGPVASALQQERVQAHIAAAIADGARLVTGGLGEPAGRTRGAWVKPTIFADVTPQMRLFRDEVFGPVLAISVYDTVDEAIRLANDSDYGLSGGVWSADPHRALEVALKVRTGTIGINGEGLDVGAPFGGVKQSGVGRECGSYGFEEFLEVKAVMGAAALLETGSTAS